MYADYSEVRFESSHQYSCTVIAASSEFTGAQFCLLNHWIALVYSCTVMIAVTEQTSMIRTVINHRSEHGSDCQETEEEVILQVARNKYLELAVMPIGYTFGT